MSFFTNLEKKLIEEYFKVIPEDLTYEIFKNKQKDLRKKYHPDNYSKYQDKTVLEIFNSKFQEIESLCDKIDLFLKSKNNQDNEIQEVYEQKNARFSFDGLRIDIITSNKDLKYYLFGTHYRWLVRGDRFRIPKTNSAFIKIEADYSGRSVGFNESIKLFLSFGIDDSVEGIVGWLFNKIVGQASFLIIENEKIQVDYFEMLLHIRKTTFLKLEK